MIRKIWIVALLAIAGYAAAQDIRVTKFERCFTCVNLNPVYDNTGTACALIRFMVRDTSMVIEPNNGYVKRETRIGEIRLHVPIATKRLTLRLYGLKPLRDYELPVRLEPKVTYDADIEAANIVIDTTVVVETPLKPEEKEGIDERPVIRGGSGVVERNMTHPYFGIGWNVVPLNGPELLLGIDVSHHVIELSGVYGLRKTDPLFYYTTLANEEHPRAAWQYGAIRGSLSYGYDFLKKERVGVVPMIGATGSYYRGINYMGIATGEYKKASSFSAFAGLRLKWAPTKHLNVNVTPRYDVNLYRSNTCKLICIYDGRLKGWTRGFNLSAGVSWVFSN